MYRIEYETANLGPLYGLVGFPGFLYAPQALSASLQLEIAYRSVAEFCEPPHATNIGLLPPKPSEDSKAGGCMWELWKMHQLSEAYNNQRKSYGIFGKLSWATCGYQYDWTSRAYHEEAKSPMPRLLMDISIPFAKASLELEGASSINFCPSACIVNYYNEKSIMGGHRDDLEWALDKPVVSFSVGLPAVYLLGGKAKEDTPVLPILVRPGDVMILGGESRLNYHGMARVLPNDLQLPDPPQSIVTNKLVVSKSSWCMDSEEEGYVRSFLKQHRININVRQVLPDGIDSIPCTWLAKRNAMV
jgi:alkylated DNA repair protein alkB family protein 1